MIFFGSKKYSIHKLLAALKIILNAKNTHFVYVFISTKPINSIKGSKLDKKGDDQHVKYCPNLLGQLLLMKINDTTSYIIKHSFISNKLSVSFLL